MTQEKRSTYVRLRDGIKTGVLAQLVIGMKEVPTCRVMINIGLELVISGVEMLKLHGITKAQVSEFLDRLYDRPGEIQGMEKGEINEPILRLAMQLINGPIIRHSALGDMVEGPAHRHDDVVSPPPPQRNLNKHMN